MEYGGFEAFDVEVSAHVARVTLKGPGKGNAMGPAFWRECPVLFSRFDGDDAVRMARQLKPDVLVLDLSMPRLPGLDALRELTAGTMSVKTLLLTSTIDSRQVLEALQLGARGVVLKDAVTDDLVVDLDATQGRPRDNRHERC